MNPEFIEIKGLEVACHIGVPDEERQSAQRLLLDFNLIPLNAFSQMKDNLDATVDYDALTRDVKQFCTSHSCKLIETLADEITSYIIAKYPLSSVSLRVKKFILPDTEYVAVHSLKRQD